MFLFNFLFWRNPSPLRCTSIYILNEQYNCIHNRGFRRIQSEKEREQGEKGGKKEKNINGEKSGMRKRDRDTKKETHIKERDK